MTTIKTLAEAQLQPIRVLVLDVDGVLTDGSITYTSGGDEIKTFNVRDGAGIAFWQAAGRHTAILTGRKSAVVDTRAAELGIQTVIQGSRNKMADFARICEEIGVSAAECVYIGDDLPDLGVIRAAGIGIAVADAAAEVKDAANAVTEECGGRGAVREVVEALLRAQGLWAATQARYQEECASE